MQTPIIGPLSSKTRNGELKSAYNTNENLAIRNLEQTFTSPYASNTSGVHRGIYYSKELKRFIFPSMTFNKAESYI